MENPSCDILAPSTANNMAMGKITYPCKLSVWSVHFGDNYEDPEYSQVYSKYQVKEISETFGKGKSAWHCFGELTISDYDFIFMTTFSLYSKH